ncbi:SET domain-containing protein [Linnemannia elongata AG-77]|uniref:SET domain-containing protein n=1 Tax=Linnemannia elongata AG-77 TaxID=1314771 RepID=A0A197KD08_9FUNG|nr:SET domain-containing protein [Linnemannia elongata AG-77]
MSSKELTAFLAWAEENEILWDKAAIEIKETPSKYGLGVFAKKRLEPGYEVIQVPKAIVLSVQTTGIANLLEDDEVEGDTALTIGCMYELSRGAQSPWAPYLALLTKRPPQMATTLSKESREMMKMCEAYNDIEADIKDLQEDFESIVVPFIEKNSDVFTAEIKAKFFTLEAFRAMMEIVSSRGMDVDNFHVTALVPFADFVNHNPMPNADYLTHEEVCEICGALACEHMEDGSDDEDDEENEDGSDDDEVPDLAGDDSAPAAGKKAAAAKGKKAEEDMEEDGEEWEDEDAEDDDDEEINDTCDIILDDEVEKGEEITRHYGPYPNKILLSKYGFAVENNPHDTVTIQLDMVRQAAQRILKDEKLIEERTAWFLENEDAFIGAEDDDEEGGCCGGGDHDHDHDHEHGHGHGHDHHGHEHAEGDDCCAPKAPKKKAAEAEADDEDDEEMEGEEEEDDFPRDIMYMMHDGSIDDRLLMLLNVLFMDKDQFAKIQEDMEAAMEYFNDIFMRREQEERGDEDEEMEEDEEEEEGHEKVPKPELGPRDEKSKKTRKAVLEAILTLIRIRADAFGVTDKTTAEQDLASLKKAKLTGPLYYGGLCVQGEKQILQNGLQGYDSFLAEL